MLENKYSDIFTEYDDSIFSEGSIDPMGLRIIWTSLGNTIFKSKLNTVSTDIRYYTINLFHHHIIQRCEQEYEDKILNLTGTSPYFNRQDLYDGIIIFLESLLTHAVYHINKSEDSSKEITVPGISKLSGIMSEPSDPKANYLFVDRKEGVLVRHILLGIHGRHKGPFQQIGIFDKNNYYLNKPIWNEVSQLFSSEPWSSLANKLIEIIDVKILSNKHHSSNAISIKLDEILNISLEESYSKFLTDDNYRETELVSYWEDKLGLLGGAVELLYTQLKKAEDKKDYEKLIRTAAETGSPDDNIYIKAICAIEPLLARIEKSMNRLLKRGTSEIDDELKDFIETSLSDPNIQNHEIQKYLTDKFLNPEALSRLKKLHAIFIECSSKNDTVEYVRQLIKYHDKLMKQRNNLSWISIGVSNKITQHRSFMYSKQYQESLQDNKWINYYYMSTVLSLYEGLYQQ